MPESMVSVPPCDASLPSLLASAYHRVLQESCPVPGPASASAEDPRVFPVRYVPAVDRFLFAELDLAMLDAPFLDQRMGDPWSAAGPRAIDTTALPAGRPAWLFHTAFCCSTLLARALHAPPATVALKEPHVLMDLASHALEDHRPGTPSLAARTDAACRLLGRPWQAGGHVLVKPTNAVNRILPELLAATPGSHAVLLHGSLEDFLYSCLKKLPGAEQPLRWMVQYLLAGTRLQASLGIRPDHPFNPVEASVLTWHAQMERYADALADDAGDRLRSLGMNTLLEAPVDRVASVARWLGLDLGGAGWEDRVAAVFARNSKDASALYDPATRRAERDALRRRFEPMVEAALEWAANAVAPHTRMPAWKDLETR